jgi:hypothetical protein
MIAPATVNPQPEGDSGSRTAVIVACVVGAFAVLCLFGGIAVTVVVDALRVGTANLAEESASTDSAAEERANENLSSGANSSASAPRVPDRFVFRPTMTTRFGPVAAGRAFLVSIPHQRMPIALTAIHLLGPAGGLDRDVPAAEVPEAIQSVLLEECFDPSIQLDIGGHALLIASAAPLGESSQAGDVAAFWVAGSPDVTALPLASDDPKQGEPVWLACPVIAGAPPQRRLHAAHIYAAEDRKLYYRYENSQIELRATSGAPVLNSNGEVVAINLGGGELEGELIGVGNPVSRFGPHLIEAATNPPEWARESSVASEADEGELTLATRQAIYRQTKLIGLTYQRSLAARERGHRRMLDSMKSKPTGKMLESMNKSNANIKQQITRSFEKSIEDLCQQRGITPDRLAEILAEGDAAGWTAPGDE